MSVAVALLVALALVLIPLGLLLLLLRQGPPDPARQPSRANWSYLWFLLSSTAFVWTMPPGRLVIVMPALSLILAVMVIVHATNWHDWGRRLAGSPFDHRPSLPYVQPVGRMHTALLAAALLSLVSDALFLGLRVR